jgi:23S rRNA pseudouridine1911/1915/1917 synthase
LNQKEERKVDKELEGQRLDQAAALLFNVTKSRVQKLINEGKISLNREKTVAKKTVKEGDLLCFIKEKKGGEADIPVLYEDKALLVINKPAGLTVHPAEGEEDWTVTELLANQKGRELFVVHRLDKGTSGVMLLAKNRKMQAKLQEQFKNRTVKKSYLVLVKGQIEPEKGIIDIPLAREETVRSKIGPASGGRAALTEYQVLEYLGKYSYLEVNPKTGRTHQIRAHFSAIGYPVVGDERYGSKDPVTPRIFLHAFSISFIHPIEMKQLSFTSPLPKDLDKVLHSLK